MTINMNGFTTSLDILEALKTREPQTPEEQEIAFLLRDGKIG